MRGNMLNKLLKHKHAILTGLTCGGVLITALTMHEDTCRANGVEKEDLKETWPNYIPSALVSGATMVAAVSNHRLSRKQIMSMIGGAGTSSKLLYEYKEKVKEIAGEDTYQEIQRAIARDREDGVIYVTAPDIEFGAFETRGDEGVDGDTLFYEEWSGIWFRSSMAAVRSAYYHYNRDFVLGSGVCFNDFLSFLGIDPRDDLGAYGHGYQMMETGIGWIDYYMTQAERDDGESYYILSFDIAPYILDMDVDEYTNSLYE